MNEGVSIIMAHLYDRDVIHSIIFSSNEAEIEDF